jgi:hypothetical protein
MSVTVMHERKVWSHALLAADMADDKPRLHRDTNAADTGEG